MKQQVLRDLIKRLEGAEGGSRELDAAIQCHVFGGRTIRFNRYRTAKYRWTTPEGKSGRVEAWTTSLDTALTLVPEGCYPTILTWHSMGSKIHGFCRMVIRGPFGKDGWHADRKGEGKSPSLAVCDAALRARLSDD